MDATKITNLVLAIALLIMAILHLNKPEAKTAEGEISASDVAIETIMTRTSVRDYLDKPVSDEKIEIILRAAMSAPTAVNKQPWAFVVVDDKEILNTLAGILPFARMTAKAPVAIVVCGDLSKALDGDAQAYWVQDASAATQNLLLAVHALELGAVWTGVYPIMDRVHAVQKTLGLPEHIIPLNVIPIGYPAGHQTPKDKWKPENIRYNSW